MTLARRQAPQRLSGNHRELSDRLSFNSVDCTASRAARYVAYLLRASEASRYERHLMDCPTCVGQVEAARLRVADLWRAQAHR